MKKLFSVLTICVLLVAAFSVSSSARTHDVVINENVFQNDWEKTWRNGYTQSLVYGFNTFLVDEDYCKTISTMGSHTAMVKTSVDIDSESAVKGKWTKEAQAKHGAGKVTWSIIF